jgi:hypothetical protein
MEAKEVYTGENEVIVSNVIDEARQYWPGVNLSLCLSDYIAFQANVAHKYEKRMSKAARKNEKAENRAKWIEAEMKIRVAGEFDRMICNFENFYARN